MGDVPREHEPQRDVGVELGTAAIDSAADRAVGAAAEPPREREVAGRSQLQLAFRRFIHHRMALVGLGLSVVLLLLAFIAPKFWKWTYADITPQYATSPSASHPFGTDSIGHDVFAQRSEERR